MTESKTRQAKAAGRCPDCVLKFASASLVRKHRADGGCTSPVALGLVQTGGVWAWPASRKGSR